MYRTFISKQSGPFAVIFGAVLAESAAWHPREHVTACAELLPYNHIPLGTFLSFLIDACATVQLQPTKIYVVIMCWCESYTHDNSFYLYESTAVQYNVYLNTPYQWQWTSNYKTLMSLAFPIRWVRSSSYMINYEVANINTMTDKGVIIGLYEWIDYCYTTASWSRVFGKLDFLRLHDIRAARAKWKKVVHHSLHDIFNEASTLPISWYPWLIGIL